MQIIKASLELIVTLSIWVTFFTLWGTHLYGYGLLRKLIMFFLPLILIALIILLPPMLLRLYKHRKFPRKHHIPSNITDSIKDAPEWDWTEMTLNQKNSHPCQIIRRADVIFQSRTMFTPEQGVSFAEILIRLKYFKEAATILRLTISSSSINYLLKRVAEVRLLNLYYALSKEAKSFKHKNILYEFKFVLCAEKRV